MDSEIDKLRKPSESEEMWSLRRAFLDRHWNDTGMTRNRLICLAQMFINIEFLSCNYDEGLMTKVKEMGEGLLDERREHRRAVAVQLFSKCERTFAQKGASKKPKTDSYHEDRPERKSRQSGDASVVVTTTHPLCAVKMKTLQALKAELAVMEHQRQPDDPLTILNQACGRAKCRWRIQFNDENRSCYVQIDDVLVTEQVYWGSQSRSRIEACGRVVEIMQRPFFDVRQAPSKISTPMADLEMELFTRKNARGEWDGPSASRFDPLESAFNNFRKRLASIPQGARHNSAEMGVRNAAELEDLPVEVKRQHLGGWKEEVIIIIGKVELYRQQGQIPPKGKEQDSSGECFSAVLDILLKPAMAEGISISEQNGVLVLSTNAKTVEKSAPATSSNRRSSSRDQSSSVFSKKELALKSVRLHLNATSDSMNPVQRIEQSCSKAKVEYEADIAESGNVFTAVVRVDGIRIGSGSSTNKKGAKGEACQDTVQRMLQTYIRVKQTIDDELTLESSNEPFQD